MAAQEPRGDRVLLVASSGGHLLELLQVAGAFPIEQRLWVTFDKSDARDLLAGEQVVYARHPTNRNLPNLLHNALLAAQIMVRVRPRAVITTGAGVAVPFCYTGRVAGARVIYVESLARVSSLSLSGRLVYPIVHRFFVQWPDLAAARRRAEFRGAVFDPA